MRTKITIIFETHGQGTVEQDNEWTHELMDLLEEKLKLDYRNFKSGKYPLVTFDFVSVEELAE